MGQLRSIRMAQLSSDLPSVHDIVIVFVIYTLIVIIAVRVISFKKTRSKFIFKQNGDKFVILEKRRFLWMWHERVILKTDNFKMYNILKKKLE